MMFSKIYETPRMPTLWNYPVPLTNGDISRFSSGSLFGKAGEPEIQRILRKQLSDMYDWAQKLNRAWAGYPVGWDERDAEV